MKIQFLGTAAAEGVPSLFCECEHCKLAWERGGKEIRTRAGSLLDGVLKLDFGPDTFAQMLRYQINLKPIKAALITHSHDDHLLAWDLGYRRKGFARMEDGDPVLTVYGNAAVGEMMQPHLNPFLRFQEVKPFETYDIEGYQVTPLQAVHYLNGGDRFVVQSRLGPVGRAEEALIYFIQKDGKSLLYAHDTDELTPENMAFLAGRKIDLITLDCTNGVKDFDYIGHMGAKNNLHMKELLLATGAADGHTVFVANHFSHNGLAAYEELEKALPGFLVSYDGLTVEC